MLELWPFTNFHDLNLDWIIKTLKVYTKKIDDLYDFGLYDYVERVLTAHPEWTTTVMDGAISTPKLADDVLEKFNENSAKTYNSGMEFAGTEDHSAFIGGMTVALQGGCYNPDNGNYFLLFPPASGTTGLMVETDTSYTSVASNTGNIGHGNDVTYYDGNYYIARAENNGEVTLVNASTLVIGITTAIPGVTAAVQNISYDEYRDIFWILDNNNVLYKVETDLNTSEPVKALQNTDIFKNDYTNVSGFYLAGSAVIDGCFTIIAYIARWDKDLPVIRLVTFDGSGEIAKYSDTYGITIYDEAETLIYNGEAIQVLGKAGGFITKYISGTGTGAIAELDMMEYDGTITDVNALVDDMTARSARRTFYHMKTNHPLFGQHDGMVLTVKVPNGAAQYGFSRGGLFFRKQINSTWYDWHGPMGILTERTTLYPPSLAAGASSDYTYNWNINQQDTNYTIVITPIYCENVAINIKSFSASSVTVTIHNNHTSAQVPSFQIAAIRKGN